jgi:stress response protein YsnF
VLLRGRTPIRGVRDIGEAQPRGVALAMTGDRAADAPGSGGFGREAGGESAMNRSHEKEVMVGTTAGETGRARLTTHVVEGHVTETVPIRREEVPVEREPIAAGVVDEPTDGAAISEDEQEVGPGAERPVTDKRAVAERVGLDGDVRRDERRSAETARQAQIDVDHARNRC